MSLDEPIAQAEVAAAVMSMNNGSSPGADGIPAEWYKLFSQHVRDPLMECFEYTYETGSLCESERVGVISLFHKGKDLDTGSLNNWRPSSLTNTDYKILAKVLSLRLNTVIDKILGDQQKGFIKGRNISFIHRQIDDILDLQRNLEDAGIILAIDYRQAFDSLDTNCIIKSLELFGFGQSFIKWIKILNTDRLACVKNGGHVSSLFSMSSGVRQGCPISPQLFIIAVEIMAQKILQDNNIKGLNPYNGSKSMKVSQYADDTSLFLHDLLDLKIAISHLDSFSVFSGLLLNYNKTFALSTNGAVIDTEGLTIQFKDTLKILGVYFSNSKPTCQISENWTVRFENCIRIFDRWSRRNLSLVGKMHIIKTFGLSQFIFIMQSIALPKDVLDRINQLFFRFLWRKKFCNRRAYEKVKRKVVCNRWEMGGLNMFDIYYFQDAILLAWIEALVAPGFEVWKEVSLYFFRNLGGKYVFRSKVSTKEMKGLEMISSLFWRVALTRWLEHSENFKSQTVLVDDPLFNNRLIHYKKQTLYLQPCLNRGIVAVKDVMQDDRIMFYREYCDKYGVYARSLLDYNVIVNALKNVNLNSHTSHDKFLLQGNAIGSLGRRQFYSLIQKTETPLCVSLWKRKYNIDIGVPHWDIIRNFKESRLKTLSWKILHNIYPTNILLEKMKIRPSINCSYCNEIDYLEHFFFSCRKVQPLWEEIKKDLQLVCGRTVNIKEEMVLCGIVRLDGINKIKLEKVNLIIAVGRLTVSKYKYGKMRNILQIYEMEKWLRKL